MCTSTSTSLHWPFFTSFRASSGSDVEIASYPKSAITAANISSCAGSSSRMHGVNADFGATISTVLVDANPTMPYLRQPVCHSCSLLPFFLRVSGLWLRTHNSMETISVIPPRRIPVAIGLGFYCNRRHLPVRNRSSNRILCPISVQEPSPSSHSGTEPPQVSRNKTPSPAIPRSLQVSASHLLFGLFFRIIMICLSRRSSAEFG